MENQYEFSKFLKKAGKKENVIQRNLSTIDHFNTYLENEKKSCLNNVTYGDIEDYVATIESKKKSPKGNLYVLMNYFKFTGSDKLYQFTRQLREERTSKTRRLFKLKDFYDVNMKTINSLEKIDIVDVKDILREGKTPTQRKAISLKTGAPEVEILELVHLADLTRIGAVKAKLARLYYNVGFTSPLMITKYNAIELQDQFKAYIENSGWEGQVPFLKDLEHNIKRAKKLKEIVVL